MKTFPLFLAIAALLTGCAGGIERYAHHEKQWDVRPIWLGPPNISPSISPGHTGGVTVVATPWSYNMKRKPQDVVGTLSGQIGPVQVSRGYKFTVPEVEVRAEWPWWFNANFPTYPDPSFQVQPSIIRGP